ncbi:hypothetical protein [Mesorhizobium sp. IMUNJ 23232]|uniref:hypothetical protein n=1 Tax=Mesorhizobium sp. IMUNJ 23232 TaxID=3376064 RepID=UPI0037AD65C1
MPEFAQVVVCSQSGQLLRHQSAILAAASKDFCLTQCRIRLTISKRNKSNFACRKLFRATLQTQFANVFVDDLTVGKLLEFVIVICGCLGLEGLPPTLSLFSRRRHFIN